MTRSSKSLPWLDWILPLVFILAIVKLFWVLVEVLFLPTEGIEPAPVSRNKSLYQPYRLASNEALHPPEKKPRPRAPADLIRDMKLLGVYQGPRHQLAVITKSGKNYVVSEGESLLGYRIESIGGRSVTLKRHGKNYRLELPSSRKELPLSRQGKPRSSAEKSPDVPETIVDEDGNKLVPRPLVDRYVNDPQKIWKDIGIDPYKKGENLQGFRVRFVRRGSDFAKLGLKRGDIITGINGESIVDYSTPMELMKNIDKLEGLTLQIQRGNDTLEIDYEIR
jgi:general secretion pathway protein C